MICAKDKLVTETTVSRLLYPEARSKLSRALFCKERVLGSIALAFAPKSICSDLLCSGYRNKMLQNGWLKHQFIFPEARKSRSRSGRVQFLVRLFLVCRSPSQLLTMAFSPVLLHRGSGCRGRELSLVLLTEPLTPS